MRPRIQFGLRTLLIVVAMAAAGMALWRRAEAFKRAAAAHADKAQECADVGWGMSRFGFDKTEVAKYWSLHQEHSRLAEEHRRAVWRPWVRFTARPPSPEPSN